VRDRVVRKAGGLPMVVNEASTWDGSMWWASVEWTECDHMETLPERDANLPYLTLPYHARADARARGRLRMRNALEIATGARARG
jgi:hypothetical protein